MGYAIYDDSNFIRYYRCYPISSMNKPHLEKGDKIVMPLSTLDSLVRMKIEYPMLFEITNPKSRRISHCGVMEFVADEGTVLLPSWMMNNLLLDEGDIVIMKPVSLPKAKYVKLQPHNMEFLNIPNPKEDLESILKHFSCLTIGDTITLPYDNNKFDINVTEAKPSFAISIIDTDCEVDFATPLDYKELENPAKIDVNVSKSVSVSFTGVGRRLDGKPSVSYCSGQLPKEQKQSSSDSSTSTSTLKRRPGKLVFGSTSGRPSKKLKKYQDDVEGTCSKDEKPTCKTSEGMSQHVGNPTSSQKDKRPTVEAFTGKKYTLRDSC